MEFNWTVVTIVGALLAQGAAIVWAVSGMVSDIKYNRANISEVQSSSARLSDEVHENDVMTVSYTHLTLPTIYSV